jgi:hypothetical protein
MKAHSDPTALKYSAIDLFSGHINSTDAQKLRNRCLKPGFYAIHLERWLDFFPSSQLIVLDGKEVREGPVDVMNSLIHSLDLPASLDYSQLLQFDPNKGFYCVGKKCLGTSKGRRYEPMPMELRSLLGRIFAESNMSLRQLLVNYKLRVPSFLQDGL